MSSNLKDQQRILRMLFDDPQDEMECCRDLIYNYIKAQIGGKDVAALFPETHAYLEEFGDEDEYYQIISSELKAERDGQLKALPPGYEPNDQLPAGIIQSTSSTQGPDKPLVVTEQDNGNILVQIVQAFVDAIPNLSIQPQLAFVRGQESIFRIEGTVGDSSSTKVTIEANKIDDNDDSCSLTVAFAREGVGWPDLGGTTVKLTDSEAQQEMEERVTDPFGKVKFDQIALDKLGDIAIAIEN